MSKEVKYQVKEKFWYDGANTHTKTFTILEHAVDYLNESRENYKKRAEENGSLFNDGSGDLTDLNKFLATMYILKIETETTKMDY